ncbi:hypothetical protein B0H13DRAFT_1851482 [Mycena leptocephala]|nr:hypothetical protein B0H13DRAFT_1851482 [Mycena leptocephala]
MYRGTYFVQALSRAYFQPKTYRTSRRCAWLRRLGTSFAMKTRTQLALLQTRTRITGSRSLSTVTGMWLAMGMDSRQHAASLRKALDWWLLEHLGEKFKWTNIPVAKQNDPHS